MGTNLSALVTGDINKDGRIDLVVADAGSHDVHILFGDGAGAIASTMTVTVGGNASSVAVNDFNSDGLLDMFDVSGI